MAKDPTKAAAEKPASDVPAAEKPAPKPRKPRAKKVAPPPPPPPVSLRTMAWVVGLVLLLDQVSKYYVVHVLRLDRVREIDVLPPWLNLHMAWNQGVNFGLFSSSQDIMRWVLIAVAVAVCGWVFLWIRRVRPGWFAQVSAGLLVGGAIGNVIDRVFYGAVADFLKMSLPNWQNPYSFNVADIAIFAGAIGLILQPPQSADKARDLAAK